MSDKTHFTKEDVKAEISDWLSANPDTPEVVRMALSGYIDLIDRLDLKSAKLRSLLGELRKSFGILPKSERRRSGQKSKPRRSRREELAESREQALISARKYEKLGKRQRRRASRIEDQMKELDDIALTPEEEAEADRDAEKFGEELSIGKRTDLCCAEPAETLMPGVGLRVNEEDVDCKLPDDKRARAKKIFVEERERIDFSFQVTVCHLQVEKGEIPGSQGPKLISASTHDVGPPKMKVTWNFLANMTILASQYAMPLNRFASLISTSHKEFQSSELARYFQYVAGRMLPVYLYHGRSLANAGVLSGDDTKSRVIEVNKALASGDITWSDYATREQAVKTLKRQRPQDQSLSARIAAEFGFEAKRKDNAGAKKSLNVSVVTGRTDIDDPKSTIVFFRSHVGGLGNILQALLEHRDPGNKDLVIQADLSTVNLLPPDLPWDIEYAGCSSHARRRFVKHEGDDAYGESMVHLFRCLYLHESSLTDLGRNRDNVLAVRQGTSRRFWAMIREDCEAVSRKWSKETGLGDAARYVLNNFDALTYYLNDPLVSISNDFCERMLRLEKLILANSHFRQSLEGRFALDITRTVLQTAIAAKVNLQAYIIWLLKADPEEVEQHPEQFTPLAFLKLYPRNCQDQDAL